MMNIIEYDKISHIVGQVLMISHERKLRSRSHLIRAVQRFAKRMTREWREPRGGKPEEIFARANAAARIIGH